MPGMALPAQAKHLPVVARARDQDSRSLLREHAAREYVFAVVGHIGSGTSTAAMQIKGLLESAGFDTHYLKASDVIREWAEEHGQPVPPDSKKREQVAALQDIGNEMRKSRRDSVACGLIELIRENRAERTRGGKPAAGEPVEPDGQLRAYVLDSIRHPAEVELLRHVYGDAFALIGVVCSEERRVERLHRKLDVGDESARALMERDAREGAPYGQQVAEAFRLADAFLDNSASFEGVEANAESWRLPEDVERLIDIVTHEKIVRPTVAESGMFHAYGSQLRSACLSRQVGAAIVDSRGNTIAVGTNDVPRAGGGVYGARDLDELLLRRPRDERCAYSAKLKYCSSTREVRSVVDDVVDALLDKGVIQASKRAEAFEAVVGSRVKGLIEFSRAVHAEMDALLSAGRAGRSVIGSTVFVTTFPCHYCARHLVAAGVDAVYFIEPYPKSLAFRLHFDALAPDWDGEPPSQGGTKVKFAPFTGVAPRMYPRAFLKNRELKDEQGALNLGPPDFVDAWHLRKVAYTELEAKLTRRDDGSS